MALKTAGLIGLFVLFTLSMIASETMPAAFVWLGGACFAVAVAFPFCRCWGKRFDGREAIYLFVLYYAFALGLRGVAILTYQTSSCVPELQDLGKPYFQGIMGWVFTLSAVGLASVYAGYESNLGSSWGERLSRLGESVTRWEGRKVVLVSTAWIAIGIVGALLYLRTFGMFVRNSGTSAFLSTEGALGAFWQVALMEFGVVGLHLLVLYVIASNKLPKAYMLLAVLYLVVTLFFFVITSAKFLLLRILIPPLLFWHTLRRRIHALVPVLLFGAFGALFPLFYAYRQIGWREPAGIVESVTRVPLWTWLTFGPLLGRAYDADSFAAVLAHTGKGVPFQFGRTLADLFYFFVPRAWWHEKPLSYGLEFGQAYLPNRVWQDATYITPSLPGELYLNFHVAGIVAGCFLLGIAMRAGLESLRKQSGLVLLLYSYFFLLAIHIVEGGIASQIEFWLLSAVPAFLAVRLVTLSR